MTRKPLDPQRIFKSAVRELIPSSLLDRINAWRTYRRARRGLGAIKTRLNPLQRPLIVSLTSFPPRFPMLHLTLKSLLSQTIAPDAIVLWIGRDDFVRLPRRVRRLEKRGITIRECDDVGSYKKLIFAVEEWPDAYIATADDDMFYDPRWLETMVSAIDDKHKVIVCHRAHRINVNPEGSIAPYGDWEPDVQDSASRAPSTDIVPTGCGGILYPPGSLREEALDREMFQRLCPKADDLWFYWMGRRAGARFIKVGPSFPMIGWPSARVSSLWSYNEQGGNDRQVRNLEKAFGNPLNDC